MGVTNYFSVDGEVIAESGASGYLSYHRDNLGSVCATLDSVGALVHQYQYKPFGELWSASGAGAQERRLQWCGSWGYSAIALTRKFLSYYVRARHYAAILGNWTSVDPLWPSEMAYGYVENRVMTMNDPSGGRGSSTSSGTTPNTVPWHIQPGTTFVSPPGSAGGHFGAPIPVNFAPPPPPPPTEQDRANSMMGGGMTGPLYGATCACADLIKAGMRFMSRNNSNASSTPSGWTNPVGIIQPRFTRPYKKWSLSDCQAAHAKYHACGNLVDDKSCADLGKRMRCMELRRDVIRNCDVKPPPQWNANPCMHIGRYCFEASVLLDCLNARPNCDPGVMRAMLNIQAACRDPYGKCLFANFKNQGNFPPGPGWR